MSRADGLPPPRLANRILEVPSSRPDTRPRCPIRVSPTERRRLLEHSVDLAGMVVTTDVRPLPRPHPAHAISANDYSTARGRVLVGTSGQILWPPTFELVVTPGLLPLSGHP